MEENGQTTVKNQVTVTGRVEREFFFSHDYYGEGFYKTNILVERLNDANDSIPVMVSDRLLDMDSCYAGKQVSLTGEFRSYNARPEGNEDVQPSKKRQLTVFAREIHLLMEDEKENEDSIYIEGFLCRPPVYRVTPLGREITELTVSVSRNYGKSDYIPCICWGRNARYAAGFLPGEKLSLTGRIQSRDYVRQNQENRPEKLTTHEVSVRRIDKLASTKE